MTGRSHENRYSPGPAASVAMAANALPHSPANGPNSRKVPDNPILHRLKSLEVKDADSRRSRPRAKRPRDVGARDVPRERRRPEPSADPRRPSRTASNIVGLELRPEEKQLLSEAGRFRVVRVADLRETLYNGKSRPLENDLRYLRDKGLIETSQVNLRRDGRRRTIERVRGCHPDPGRSPLASQAGRPA